MLQPQLSVDERMEGAGVSDMSYEKHFLEHFHKACFNLLHELVMDMNSPALQMTVFLTPVIFLYKELLKCLVY